MNLRVIEIIRIKTLVEDMVYVAILKTLFPLN